MGLLGIGDAIGDAVESGADALGLGGVGDAADSLIEEAGNPASLGPELFEQGAEALGADKVAGYIDQGQNIAKNVAASKAGIPPSLIGGSNSRPSRQQSGGCGIPPSEKRAFQAWARRYPRAARAFKRALQNV